jgi:hypothetical protein
VSYVNRSMIFDTLHKKDRCIGPGLCIMLEVNFAFWGFSEVRLVFSLMTCVQMRVIADDDNMYTSEGKPYGACAPQNNRNDSRIIGTTSIVRWYGSNILEPPLGRGGCVPIG